MKLDFIKLKLLRLEIFRTPYTEADYRIIKQVYHVLTNASADNNKLYLD